MAQVSSVTQPPFMKWQQPTTVPPADERRQQQGQQHRQDADGRFHIPDDEQEIHIDEYV